MVEPQPLLQGYQTSPIDLRDHQIRFHDTSSPSKDVPVRVVYDQLCPMIYDQGQLGSCTANAAATMITYIYRTTQNKIMWPSRLFLYYNTRLLENTVSFDAGATLRSTMKSLSKYGVCRETVWPYQLNRFALQPSQPSYKEASLYCGLAYASLLIDVDQIKQALRNQFVVIVGMYVYADIYSVTAKTPTLRLPNTKTQRPVGGHALCIIGYDDTQQAFLVRNSWGRRWGSNGNLWIPYDYFRIQTPSGDLIVLEAWTLYQMTVFPTSSSYRILKGSQLSNVLT